MPKQHDQGKYQVQFYPLILLIFIKLFMLKYYTYHSLLIIIEACKKCKFDEFLCGIFRRTGNLNNLQNMTLIQICSIYAFFFDIFINIHFQYQTRQTKFSHSPDTLSGIKGDVHQTHRDQLVSHGLQRGHDLTNGIMEGTESNRMMKETPGFQVNLVEKL